MRYTQSNLLIIYLLIDLIILNLSVVVIAWLDPFIDLFAFHSANYASYILHANLSWMITYLWLSKKNIYLRDGMLNRFRRITLRTGFFVVVGLVISALFMRPTFSRKFFFDYTLLFYLTKTITYIVFYGILAVRRSKDLNVNRSIIVGVNPTSLRLRKMIDNNPVLGFKFIGYVSDLKQDEVEVLGRTDELGAIIEKYQIEMLFVSFSLFGQKQDRITKDYLKLCNKKGVRVRFIHENQRWLRSKANLESVGDIVLLNPQEIPLDDLSNRIIKRTFDIVFSTLFILLIFSWLLPLVAILIKLSSRGPVFFIQKRTGINNRPFCCLKFRSMYVNENADKVQAAANDARITPIGKILRRSNIDEMPQFLNVFVGQMSVVGPRPHMLEHTAQYSDLIDGYLVRHYVKPGVTGLAQISGFRGRTDELWKMEKRVEMDMEYIQNWSFWFDLKIIFRTIFDKRTYINAS